MKLVIGLQPRQAIQIRQGSAPFDEHLEPDEVHLGPRGRSYQRRLPLQRHPQVIDLHQLFRGATPTTTTAELQVP